MSCAPGGSAEETAAVLDHHLDAVKAGNIEEIMADTGKLTISLDALELQAMLSDPLDKNNCILSINAGAGGTESCDWAEMLMRMYKRWSERRDWKVEMQDLALKFMV